MTTSKKLDYFLQPERLPAISGGVLVDVNAAAVYTTIEAMLATTARSFWGTDEEYVQAYSSITESAAGLLMDATNRIIRAVWETRGGMDTTLTPTDTGLYPGVTDRNSVREVIDLLQQTYDDNGALLSAINTNVDSIRQLVEQIEAEGGGWTEEEKAELLARLVTIVGAL